MALRTVGGAVTITWDAYASRVRQIAAGLARLGIGYGDAVALMMANRPEFHLADTAVFHLGAVPFSVYNTAAAGQIAHVLADSGCRVVVCEEQFAGRVLEAAAGTAVRHVVCVDGRPDGTITLEELAAGGDPGFGFEDRWRAVTPDDLLTLVYTSGTTGPPKAVEITHAQAIASLMAAGLGVAQGAARPREPGNTYLPMAHIVERLISHYRRMFGGVQVTTLADTTALPGALADVRPTFFVGVPRVWEKLKAGIDALVASRARPGQAAGRAGGVRGRAPVRGRGAGGPGAGRAGRGLPAGRSAGDVADPGCCWA